MLKPGVVFFGELLPAAELERATELARRARLLLVVGSSLEVHPVAGLPLETLRHGGALAIVNLGPTPLDGRADLRLDGSAGAILRETVRGARSGIAAPAPLSRGERRLRALGRRAAHGPHVENPTTVRADLLLDLVRDPRVLTECVRDNGFVPVQPTSAVLEVPFSHSALHGSARVRWNKCRKGEFAVRILRVLGSGNIASWPRTRRTFSLAMADLGEEALQRLPHVPGGNRLMDMVNQSRTRLDDVQKRLRGLDVLEQRVDKLERRLAKLESSATTKKAAAKKPTAASKPAAAKKPPA